MTFVSLGHLLFKVSLPLITIMTLCFKHFKTYEVA